MKKKVFIAIFIVVLTLCMSACNESDNRVQTNDNKETKAPKVENTNDPNNQQKLSISNYIDYKITEFTDSKSTDKLNYKIKYPQLFGMSDVDKQNELNNTLKDEALKVLKYYEEPSGFVDINIDYKIVLETRNILSIQYSGVGDVSNAAHPNNLFYTTNINIKSGERLRLKDIVNIDEDLASKFLNDGFKALWPAQGEALKHFTNEEIKQNFTDADSLDYIGTEKQADVFSYFTNDSLGISISVSHAIGDHAEFEIKYQDIKDNAKTENEIWNDLLNPAFENNYKK
ncbi:PdaC/SigV domain-containing protein [Paenibacillus sp. sgz5001063]|uniref:PdaC/SigV domain-containing protein n=1 Tax=Paenibacillus sp. sgz5001063 TaxID=3242474 RepID=UPI0036D25C76